MTTSKLRFLLVHLLPVAHICACLTIALAHLDAGWEFLGLMDFPASIMVVTLIYDFDHPLILFGIIGTLWWYVLSRAFEMAGNMVWAAFQRRRVP
jgi:hypothetical protein